MIHSLPYAVDVVELMLLMSFMLITG